MNKFTLILTVFLIIYIFILISVYVFQRNLLYHPTENNYFGDKLLVPIEKVTIKQMIILNLYRGITIRMSANIRQFYFFMATQVH